MAAFQVITEGQTLRSVREARQYWHQDCRSQSAWHWFLVSAEALPGRLGRRCAAVDLRNVGLHCAKWFRAAERDAVLARHSANDASHCHNVQRSRNAWRMGNGPTLQFPLFADG